ncbi:MAG: hypothetical protein IJ622_06255 [Bacteroidales bacterium]|nr:hypothetical protein [Bacteroidales bacterium]
MFFEKILERYPQLDEYWVIARSENKLKELAGQHPQQKVRVVPMDLSGTRMLLSPSKMDTAMFHQNSTDSGNMSIQPYLNLDKVTVKAMQKAERGCAAYTPMAFYKVYRILAKIVPSAIMVKFTSVEGSIPKE